MNPKWIKFAKIMGLIMLYLLFASLGFILGMAYEQVLITKAVTYFVSYSNIKVDVNFNETKLVEEMNNNFIPAWKTAFNETLQKEIEK